MKKKILIKILGLVLLTQILIVGTGMVASAANNCKDTTFYFDFSKSQVRWTGYVRLKTDYSHSYEKCNYTPANKFYTSWVVGAYTENGDGHDASHGHVYTFTSGTTYWMLNWVKEEGFSYAGIAGQSVNGDMFGASGVWSPDSV